MHTSIKRHAGSHTHKKKQALYNKGQWSRHTFSFSSENERESERIKEKERIQVNKKKKLRDRFPQKINYNTTNQK